MGNKRISMPAKKQNYSQRQISERDARKEEARKRLLNEYGSIEPTEKECRARGMGYRQPTITKSGALRKPSCVKQAGLKQDRKRTQVRIAVRKGTLAPWKAVLPPKERHEALLQAIERAQDEFDLTPHDAAIKIVRKLNALYIYRKNNRARNVVEVCNKILDDEEWLREHFGLNPLDRSARRCPTPMK